MNTSRCVLNHHGQPAGTARGINLCAGHLEQLHQDLNDLELLLALIHDMTVPGRGDGNRRGFGRRFGRGIVGAAGDEEEQTPTE